MRRAIILIVTLTLFTFTCALLLDRLQRQTADAYLIRLETVRSLVLSGSMDAARSEQAYAHALWQHDAHWLNWLIDHHHTRDMDSAMTRLATALQQENRLASLLLLDEAADVLEEVAQHDLNVLENIL